MIPTSLAFLLLLPAVFCQRCMVSDIKKSKDALTLVLKKTTNSDDEQCPIPIPISEEYSASLWTLGENDSVIRYAVVESFPFDTLIAVRMIQEETVCGENVWVTDNPKYIVMINGTLSNSKFPDRSKFYNKKNYEEIQKVHETMMMHCELKYLQNKTIVEFVMENPLALYLLIVVLGYIIWNVLVSIFNVLVNCCTLADVNNKRRKCCCTYIFNSLCPSLTSRHIYERQQDDFGKSYHVPLAFPYHGEDVNSANKEFDYLTSDLYENIY